MEDQFIQCTMALNPLWSSDTIDIFIDIVRRQAITWTNVDVLSIELDPQEQTSVKF